MRKLTPISPEPGVDTGPSSPDASSRRTATPTELPGTTTVTGASGDACFARAISAAQRLGRGAPVRSGDDAQRHAGDRTTRLRHAPWTGSGSGERPREELD